MDFGYTIFGGMIRRDEDGEVVFDNAEPSPRRVWNELARLNNQLTTLIREVAAMRKWHDSVHMSILYDTDARRSMLNSREATDSNPDLQARIAREMESQ
jgi:hypothetical protein